MADAVSRTPLPPIEERYSFLMHRINAHLARICNPMFRHWQVDIDMARMLVVLKQEGDMAAGEIVRFMALPQSTISHQLKRLEKLGYVERSIGAKDSRVMVASLTARGREVADESNELSRKVTSAMVDAIAHMDGAALRAALMTMDKALAELREVEQEDVTR